MSDDEVERIWKESVTAHSRYHRDIFLGGLRKTTITPLGIASAPVEIQTENLSATSL
jgi:hypothetical protein